MENTVKLNLDIVNIADRNIFRAIYLLSKTLSQQEFFKFIKGDNNENFFLNYLLDYAEETNKLNSEKQNDELDEVIKILFENEEIKQYIINFIDKKNNIPEISFLYQSNIQQRKIISFLDCIYDDEYEVPSEENDANQKIKEYTNKQPNTKISNQIHKSIFSNFCCLNYCK